MMQTKSGGALLNRLEQWWAVPKPAGPPALEVHDLVAGYGPLEVLHGVSIRVEPGEAVAVLGANGAGKTTLLRAISGGTRARKGTVTFAGIDITARRPDEIVRLGMAHILEGRQIFVRQTVLENLLLGRMIRKDRVQAKADLNNVLEVFPQLKGKVNQVAGELSGGQQQMLAIARALMADPKLLLLDEPSLGLAPALMEELTELIRRIRTERGMGIILVEQNVFMASQLTGRAYIMQSGRVVSEEKSAELMGDRELLAAYLGTQRAS